MPNPLIPTGDGLHNDGFFLFPINVLTMLRHRTFVPDKMRAIQGAKHHRETPSRIVFQVSLDVKLCRLSEIFFPKAGNYCSTESLKQP